jgi:hypothetical protein
MVDWLYSLTSENRPNTTNIIVSRQDVNLKCCFLLISMVVDRAHRFRIGTKSVGVEALGVDRKVRDMLVGWTGNEPGNGGRGYKLSELKSD